MGRLNGFSEFLPQNGLAVREEQITLCHDMLDTLLQNNIALCDAGVGIGKTYAYLTACILLKKFAPHGPDGSQPVVGSTSSGRHHRGIHSIFVPDFSGEPHHSKAHPGDGAKRQGTLCLRCLSFSAAGSRKR